jgi:hypothetical protein
VKFARKGKEKKAKGVGLKKIENQKLLGYTSIGKMSKFWGNTTKRGEGTKENDV